MASKVITHLIEPGKVTIVVEHGGFDSFSRSVGPTATRYLRQKVSAYELMSQGFWKPGSAFTRETWEHDPYLHDPADDRYVMRVPFSFEVDPAKLEGATHS